MHILQELLHEVVFDENIPFVWNEVSTIQDNCCKMNEYQKALQFPLTLPYYCKALYTPCYLFLLSSRHKVYRSS